LPLVVELPRGNWKIAASGARVDKNRITMQAPVKMLELEPMR